ncbi:MAG TPA: hypothetical protein VJJ98_00360 [Sedimentisphaerales bacterium]|nr:hypothetical protein [Sedimentisphaerales bacterium]
MSKALDSCFRRNDREVGLFSLEGCSVESLVGCHFERVEGEPRNLFFNRFLDFGPIGPPLGMT